MRNQAEIDAILQNVQQKLVTKKNATGLALRVPAGGYVQNDDWLSIIVEPETAGMRAFQYVDALGEIEDELRDGGLEKVVIVPAIVE